MKKRVKLGKLPNVLQGQINGLYVSYTFEINQL